MGEWTGLLRGTAGTAGVTAQANASCPAGPAGAFTGRPAGFRCGSASGCWAAAGSGAACSTASADPPARAACQPPGRSAVRGAPPADRPAAGRHRPAGGRRGRRLGRRYRSHRGGPRRSPEHARRPPAATCRWRSAAQPCWSSAGAGSSSPSGAVAWDSPRPDRRPGPGKRDGGRHVRFRAHVAATPGQGNQEESLARKR
jgi:hypothetical protein